MPSLPFVMNSCTLFSAGLDRVAKPIRANPNYRDILGNRIDRFFSRYSVGPKSPREALAILDRSMYNKRICKHLAPASAAVAFGKTKNNLREFDFLRAFLSKNDLDDRIFNTGLIPPAKTGVLMNDVLGIGEIRQRFLQHVESAPEDLADSVLFQLIQYVHAYLNWRTNFEDLREFFPRLVIVANDHSPSTVAFSIAAKERGIPRIYIQHAEVSDAFPGLDFELSILRNEISRKIYEAVAPISGDVHVVSRETSNFNLSNVELSTEGSPTVGVYLTAQVDWQGLVLLLKSLEDNECIRSIFIKPHPATPNQIVERQCPGFRVCSEIPPEPHVAVVANSSVVIELLHRCIPVFQYYGMDTVPDDYYGFSRQGIAPRIECADAQTRFWTTLKLDDDWLSRYAKYNPQADPSHGESESQLARQLEPLFKPATSRHAQLVHHRRALIDEVGDTGQDFYRISLKLFPNTIFDSLNGVVEPGGSSNLSTIDGKFIRAFDSIFADRSPVAYELFELAQRRGLIKSTLVHWLKRRGIEITGRAISDYELDQLRKFAVSDELMPDVRQRFEMLMLLFLIRVNNDKQIGHFMAKAKHVEVRHMSMSQRIAIMNWLRRKPLRERLINLSFICLYDGLSPYDRFKLNLLSASQAMFVNAPWRHEKIENRFIALAPDAISKEFATLVRPRYDDMRSRMKYMDVRWSQPQRDEMFERIRSSLASRLPFSLVRLSDGEGYIFGPNYRHFTDADMRKRERHWWRDELVQQVREDVWHGSRSAAKNADILGIPCVYRFVRDVGAKGQSLLCTTQGRGLMEVLSWAQEFSNDSQLLTEEKCNLPLFSNPARLHELARQASRVVLVGSATQRAIECVFRDVASFVYISVPTHARTMANWKYESSERSLPYICGVVRDKIAATIGPGDLVLVAAGVAGKVFIDDAKRAGGVALDVGSSLDEWVEAGIHSLH